jgi:hypothetical protein
MLLDINYLMEFRHRFLVGVFGFSKLSHNPVTNEYLWNKEKTLKLLLSFAVSSMLVALQCFSTLGHLLHQIKHINRQKYKESQCLCNRKQNQGLKRMC